MIASCNSLAALCTCSAALNCCMADNQGIRDMQIIQRLQLNLSFICKHISYFLLRSNKKYDQNKTQNEKKNKKIYILAKVTYKTSEKSIFYTILKTTKKFYSIKKEFNHSRLTTNNKVKEQPVVSNIMYYGMIITD